MGTKWLPKCSLVGVDFKYIFGFALCKEFNTGQKEGRKVEKFHALTTHDISK